MTALRAVRQVRQVAPPRRRPERGNENGGVYGLTVLTPVLPEREEILRARLQGLPRDLFARLPTTHFARLVLVPALPAAGLQGRRDRLQSPHLLFSSTFDAPLEPYLDTLCAELAPEAEAIWGCCAGFPGAVAERPAAFKSYLRRNQLRTGLFFNAYPSATVARVRRTLERRAALQAFVVAAQRLEPSRLQAEFLRQFGNGDREAS
jgi:hypothetical protein